MTIDPHTYAFAENWLKHAGWSWSGDHQKLAELVQECCEEYVKELEEQYEKNCHD